MLVINYHRKSISLTYLLVFVSLLEKGITDAFSSSTGFLRGYRVTRYHGDYLLHCHESKRKGVALKMSFFKDLLDKAFENDQNLSSNKAEGQLEGPNDDSFDIASSQKTDVQKKWLQQQQLSRRNPPAKAVGSHPSFGESGSTRSGAPMNPNLLPNTTWKLYFYLTGTPDFDPSSSLYGARVNISNRRRTGEGFAIGADQLPAEPSAVATIRLLEDGVCIAEPSSFTTGEKAGQWILSDDCRTIRISFDVSGYKRTVTTKGSIQNIYWSDRDDVERKTSATYSISPGWVYAEGYVGYGSEPGILTIANVKGVGNDEPSGILRVEKRVGLLGAGSKLLTCGKFFAEMLQNEDRI